MILAVVGRAFTGKSGVAHLLEERYGFQVASFTDYLKELTAYAVNVVAPGRGLSVAEIKQNKDTLRRLVQEFGSAIHYETDPNWIMSFIDALPNTITGTTWRAPTEHCVIDNLRSDAQVRGAHLRGVKVVGIDATHATRCHLAAKTIGVSDPLLGRKLVKQADEHPIDGDLDLSKLDLDLRVINDHRYPLVQLADEIAFWASAFVEVERAQKEQAIAAMEEAYGEDL